MERIQRGKNDKKKLRIWFGKVYKQKKENDEEEEMRQRGRRGGGVKEDKVWR